MKFDRSAIFGRACDGNLEFARQVGEFRMQRRPLADQFRPNTGIIDFFGVNAGVLIGGHVTDAITRRLNRVHFNACQFFQNVRRIFKARPVELNILTGREVAVSPVISACDLAQFPHLRRRQQTVRNGDPQHVRMQLQIKAVHQAERLKLVFGHLAGQTTAHLASELIDAVLDKSIVEFII